LAAALRQLLEDEEFRQNVARRCREAVADLSWNASAAVLRDLLRSAAGLS
jgi:glycosyltransferase involved in cell wall biosynthesis